MVVWTVDTSEVVCKLRAALHYVSSDRDSRQCRLQHGEYLDIDLPWNKPGITWVMLLQCGNFISKKYLFAIMQTLLKYSKWISGQQIYVGQVSVCVWERERQRKGFLNGCYLQWLWCCRCSSAVHLWWTHCKSFDHKFFL